MPNIEWINITADERGLRVERFPQGGLDTLLAKLLPEEQEDQTPGSARQCYGCCEWGDCERVDLNRDGVGGEYWQWMCGVCLKIGGTDA